MSKKVQAPPAKTAQSAVKVAEKVSKPVAKGAFDVAAFTKTGIPEDQVQEIKNAFDLFDTDQGGSIDTKGILHNKFRTQSRYDLPRI